MCCVCSVEAFLVPLWMDRRVMTWKLNEICCVRKEDENTLMKNRVMEVVCANGVNDSRELCCDIPFLLESDREMETLV